ncbi:MAG TPA: exonuclease domain-containing protein [Bacillota bacterium]|nr:exonuclease domain-containing protein [Bacillota bacterium]
MSALPELPELIHDLQPGPETGLACILDTETTGLGAADEAIELAMVLFAYNRNDGTVLGIVDRYTGLREPTVPIGQGAYQVHGISAEAVRGKRLDFDRVESILHRAEFIIAHNAPFDQRYVFKLSDTAREKPWLCSMNGIDWYRKGFGTKALQGLLAKHTIAAGQAHRALDDVLGVLHLLSRERYLAELLKL